MHRGAQHDGGGYEQQDGRNRQSDLGGGRHSVSSKVGVDRAITHGFGISVAPFENRPTQPEAPEPPHTTPRFADEFPNAATVASGLRVPRAIGDFLILDALRASGGTAVEVTDEELICATREVGAAEGIFCAPEGAACLPALRKLIDDGRVGSNDRVVIFNTGSGVKYLEAFS